jgi:hypothetical protein
MESGHDVGRPWWARVRETVISAGAACLAIGLAGGLVFGYVLSQRGDWLVLWPWILYAVCLIAATALASFIDERRRFHSSASVGPLTAGGKTDSSLSVEPPAPAPADSVPDVAPAIPAQNDAIPLAASAPSVASDADASDAAETDPQLDRIDPTVPIPLHRSRGAMPWSRGTRPERLAVSQAGSPESGAGSSSGASAIIQFPTGEKRPPAQAGDNNDAVVE